MKSAKPAKGLPARKRATKPTLTAVAASITAIDGGAGDPPEPDWAMIFDDELDRAAAHEFWGFTVREMRTSGTLTAANGHQIKRLVVSYVMHDLAARRIAEQQPIVAAKRTKVPTYNPWWTILKDARKMAIADEAELALSPRRRKAGGKVSREKPRARPSDAYLKAKEG